MAATTQLDLAVAMGDEVDAPAFRAWVVVDRVAGEARTADPLSGAVNVGEMAVAATARAFAPSVALIPAAPATPESIQSHRQGSVTTAKGTLRNPNPYRASFDEKPGQPHRVHRTVRAITTEHFRVVMDDPIQIALRHIGAECGGDGVDFGAAESRSELLDALTHFGRMVDIGLRSAASAQQPTTPGAIRAYADFAAVDTLSFRRPPSLGGAGPTYAFAQLPRVRFGVAGLTACTGRESYCCAADLLDGGDDRFDVGDAVATGRPRQHGRVLPKRSGQSLQLRRRQRRGFDCPADGLRRQMRLEIADRADDVRGQLGSGFAHDRHR
ncbi:hypothetical protein AAHH97_06500 [Mycolicibacterium elephantis]|uniref:hypothetical protein n=1 Tax=Mycolicibacterium elephantis TaxID=81858 RepID=UPI001F1862D0|nr:hypothetical protein [Mycolicibacterium elephantis]